MDFSKGNFFYFRTKTYPLWGNSNEYSQDLQWRKNNKNYPFKKIKLHV